MLFNPLRIHHLSPITIVIASKINLAEHEPCNVFLIIVASWLLLLLLLLICYIHPSTFDCDIIRLSFTSESAILAILDWTVLMQWKLRSVLVLPCVPHWNILVNIVPEVKCRIWLVKRTVVDERVSSTNWWLGCLVPWWCLKLA